MTGFAIAAALLSALAALIILARAARAARSPNDDVTLDSHRRQLTEIEDLVRRGQLAPAEARAARAETARRMLAAARTDPAPPPGPPTPGVRRGLAAAAAAAPLIAALVYFAVGAPGLADQPYAARLAQWRDRNPAELSTPEIEAVLRAASRDQPQAVQPLVYLAEIQAGAGRFAEASRNLRRAVTLSPSSAGLWSALGQAETAAAGGARSTAAETAFARALRLDPADPVARYHLARAQIDRGEVGRGLAAWRRLAADLPTADPRRRALEAEIAGVAASGQLPPAM